MTPSTRMMQRNHAVVIGAGVAGLSLAVHLARRGFKVDVLEKQPVPGGRCGRLTREGHHFDLGATLLLLPELFRSLYADWDEDLHAHLDLKPLDPIYKIYYENRGLLSFTPNLAVLRPQLEAREKGSFTRFLNYFDLGCRQYQELMSRFLGRNFNHALDYFNPVNAYHFLTLQAHRNHYRLARDYFQDPALLAAFTFQNIYIGHSPFSSSATYALLPAMELAQGGWYPAGGMHSIVRSLERLAKKAGVRFHYKAEVTGIAIDQGDARGVYLGDGNRMEADVVAANADLPYVYRRLLPASRMAARLERKRYTCSAIVFHWGLSRTFSELGHHNIFLAEDYRGAFQAVTAPRPGPPSVSSSPHFYLNRPTHTDPSAAPAGGDSFTVIVSVPHRPAEDGQDWKMQANLARQAVLDRLKREGLATVEQSIKFEVCYTPPVWEKSLNLSRGSVFGSLDHSLLQVGYLRPANRHPTFRNLYFTGGSTHPGSGVPLAMLSGRLTAERILKDHGIRNPFPKKVVF